MTPHKPKKAKAVSRYTVALDDKIMTWALSYTMKGAREAASALTKTPWVGLRAAGYRVIRVEVREVVK